MSFEEGFLIPNISPDFVQNIVLDILIWITFIQMNDKRCVLTTRQVSHQGFFGVFSGAEIWPHSQWHLGDFFPILKKKYPNLPKKKKKIFFKDSDFHPVITHTHKLQGDILLQFNGNGMCNS